MTDIDTLLTRLESAGELGELLAVAWEAFGLLLAGCRDGERRSAELSAAFAFAAAVAAEGRLVIDSAPSLTGPGARASDEGCVIADPETAADDLAGLARSLGVRLSSAARDARGDGDREACGEAAAKAARIGELLARDG